MPFADLIAKSPYPALTWFLVVLLVMLSMYFAKSPKYRPSFGSAADVLSASSEMARQSEMLRSSVDKFLDDIKAA